MKKVLSPWAWTPAVLPGPAGPMPTSVQHQPFLAPPGQLMSSHPCPGIGTPQPPHRPASGDRSKGHRPADGRQCLWVRGRRQVMGARAGPSRKGQQGPVRARGSTGSLQSWVGTHPHPGREHSCLRASVTPS